MNSKVGSRIVSSLRGAPRLAAAGIREHWRSAVMFTTTILALVLLTWLLGSVGVVDLGFISRNWGTLWGPAWLSVGVTTAAFFLGFLFAIPLGALRAHGPSGLRSRRPGGRTLHTWRQRIRRPLAVLGFSGATGYVEGLRGTPFYVQVWVIYYVALLVWPRFDYVFLLAGLLALTLNTIAYQAEVLRAGFQSVGQGQVDAAKSIGMRGLQVFRHVSLPQGLRVVTLPLVNEWISLFKASSVLSFIAIEELTFQGNNLGSNLGHPIEAFFMIAVVYLGITVPLSRVLTYVERKRRIPGLGVPAPGPRRGRPGGAAPFPGVGLRSRIPQKSVQMGLSPGRPMLSVRGTRAR